MISSNLVDKGCDLWALGIILNKLLTGKYLFFQENDFKTFEAIQKGQFTCDPALSPEAADLIK